MIPPLQRRKRVEFRQIVDHLLHRGAYGLNGGLSIHRLSVHGLDRLDGSHGLSVHGLNRSNRFSVHRLYRLYGSHRSHGLLVGVDELIVLIHKITS